MQDKDLEKFKILLNESYEWPCNYTFKFIVPAKQISKLESLVDDIKIQQRPSKNGSYISSTFTVLVKNSDEVIGLYQKISVIEGVISL